MHSDDGDDYGLLIYTQPVMERPTAEWSWQSLGGDLEVVLRRGGEDHDVLQRADRHHHPRDRGA